MHHSMGCMCHPHVGARVPTTRTPRPAIVTHDAIAGFVLLPACRPAIFKGGYIRPPIPRSNNNNNNDSSLEEKNAIMNRDNNQFRN